MDGSSKHRWVLEGRVWIYGKYMHVIFRVGIICSMHAIRFFIDTSSHKHLLRWHTYVRVMLYLQKADLIVGHNLLITIMCDVAERATSLWCGNGPRLSKMLQFL